MLFNTWVSLALEILRHEHQAEQWSTPQLQTSLLKQWSPMTDLKRR